MAYTRIHAIKTTLNKALDYIENPQKTQEQILISGYNVDPLSASIEYEMTAALAREIKGNYDKTGGNNNLAYHMIQSFAVHDRLKPIEAHEIGKKWADEILKGKYEYVISTHVDKGHIHNHIIFNAVSFYDYKKYETKPYKTAALLRNISDKLCEEQGLYVIKNPNLKQKSPTHYEWNHKQNGTSWKVQIKDIIDKAINENKDYESFKEALVKANVEIKDGKRISFKINGVGQERFCRGDRIGENYSKEKILERLKLPNIKQKEKILPLKQEETKKDILENETKTIKPEFSSYDKQIEWKAQQTKIANTKELASALMVIRNEGIHKEDEFDLKINTLSEKVSNVRSTMNELSEKNKQYKDVAKYLISFKQYLPIKQEYEKQLIFTKKRFAGLHESELKAFDHAAKKLEELGINTNVDSEKVIALVKNQDEKIVELSSNLKSVSARIDSIRKAQQIVNDIKKEDYPSEKQKKKEQEISL